MRRWLGGGGGGGDGRALSAGSALGDLGPNWGGLPRQLAVEAGQRGHRIRAFFSRSSISFVLSLQFVVRCDSSRERCSMLLTGIGLPAPGVLWDRPDRRVQNVGRFRFHGACLVARAGQRYRAALRWRSVRDTGEQQAIGGALPRTRIGAVSVIGASLPDHEEIGCFTGTQACVLQAYRHDAGFVQVAPRRGSGRFFRYWRVGTFADDSVPSHLR